MGRISKTVLLGAGSVVALTTALTIAAPTSAQRSVERIVVEAQRREQSQQDVPLSIGAYSAQQIDNAGVRDIRDLIQIAPGLMVTSTQSETITTARIRGLGTVGDNIGLESSVAVTIDGVYRPRNGVSFNDLGDIERIEVLRGPQGTLFGRNTSAGVINIVTAAPDLQEFGIDGEASFGNYDLRRFSASVSGPIAQDVAGLSLYLGTARRDGYNDLVIIPPGTTTGTITDVDDQSFVTGRIQFLFAPTSNFEGRIILDATNREERCCSAVAWDYSPTIAGLLAAPLYGTPGVVRQIAPANPEARTAYSNHPYMQGINEHGASAQFDWDTDVGTLTSITGWRNWETSRSSDIDYSALDIASFTPGRNTIDFETFSQEVRLAGVHGRLDWLVGGFYAHENIDNRSALQFGEDWDEYLSVLIALGAGGAPDPTWLATNLLGNPALVGNAIARGTGIDQDIYRQETDSYAIFTHNTISITDRLDITIGLRYTHEEKDLDASFSTNQPAACAVLEGLFGPDPAGTAAAIMHPLAGAIPNICLPYARSTLDTTGYDQSIEDDDVSGTFRVSFAVTDDILLYAGYARGFKAGGFNHDRQFNGTFSPALGGYVGVDTSFVAETTDALDVGFNSELFGNALRLNGNAFYQRTEDFQLNSFTGVQFVVDSVPRVNVHGVELDFLWAPPVEGLDINGGIAWIDGQYDDFMVPGNAGLNALSGQRITLSPEWFVNAGATYERPITNGLMGRFHIDTRWVSEYNTGSDLDAEKLQDSFALVNASIGIGDESGAWELELWGRNLTDETYAQVAFDAFAQGRRGGDGTRLGARSTASYDAFLGAPLTWGVTLRSSF